jgi:phosphatidylglycerol---prolipoprotein diacylglyceryl transferase
MILAAIEYPQWLSPQVAPGIPIRWYGVMYLAAFMTTIGLFRHEARRTALTRDGDQIASFFYWIILGALLGARVFSVFVFGDAAYFLARPWLIFWPFRDGRFVGIQGMSYHGGLLGTTVAIVVFALIHKVNVLDWGDTLAVAAPLGYAFGRIGNFINGELAGRVTTVSWGVVFPQVERFPVSEPWVAEVMRQTGLSPPGAALMVNLPRHPSQLYEAALEGVVLWLILWLVFRPRRPFPGACIALYVSGYGIARFLAEYFRSIHGGAGYAVVLGPEPAPPYFTTSVLNLSSEQIVSAGMIAAGLLLYLVFRLIAPEEPVVETFVATG